MTKEYAHLEETSDSRFAKTIETSDGKITKPRRLYPARVGVCIGVFILSLIISFSVFPLIPNLIPSSQVGPISIITGITAGIVMGLIFVIDDNLKTQLLNEKLTAKDFEIRMKRNKILLLLQDDATEGLGKSTERSGDEGGGSSGVDSMIQQARDNNKTLREVDKLSDLKKDIDNK